MFWLFLPSLSARRAWIEIFVPFDVIRPAIESLSARRAWIEIFYYCDHDTDWIRSLSARRAWIEILKQLLLKTLKASLSARRAWIEMENSGTQADPAKCRSPQGERG